MSENSFRVDLQFHPFVGSDYGVLDILEKMERKGINALGCLEYSWQKGVSLDPVRNIGEKVKEGYIVNFDNNVFCFENKENGKCLYLILGQEVAPPNQEWHFLSIGALGIRPWRDPRNIMDEILDKGGLLIFDHPFADPQKWFADISREKEEELLRFCQQYRGRMALEWNGYSIPWLRRVMGYGNVNKKTEELAEEFNIAVVPTTDVHGINREALNAIGTCFIDVPAKDMDYGNIVQSLKDNILSFNFEPREDYVSFRHFLAAFVFPYIIGSKISMAAG